MSRVKEDAVGLTIRRPRLFSLGHDMDVRRIAYLGIFVLTCIRLDLGFASSAMAASAYTIIDLGPGSLAFGSGTNGAGTITAPDGRTYAFLPTQNHLPESWATTTEGAPTVADAPVHSAMTYGNPKNAYSKTSLISMNADGLAAGINTYGVNGHEGGSTAMYARLLPGGMWGSAAALWSGGQTWGGDGGMPSHVGILGISSSGQILGFGLDSPFATQIKDYLQDTSTGARVDLSDLVNTSKWTPSELPTTAGTAWLLNAPAARLDDQGRILLQATWGYDGPAHNLLLVPEGVSADPLSVPEPAGWSVFATLLAVGVVARRACART